MAESAPAYGDSEGAPQPSSTTPPEDPRDTTKVDEQPARTRRARPEPELVPGKSRVDGSALIAWGGRSGRTQTRWLREAVRVGRMTMEAFQDDRAFAREYRVRFGVREDGIPVIVCRGPAKSCGYWEIGCGEFLFFAPFRRDPLADIEKIRKVAPGIEVESPTEFEIAWLKERGEKPRRTDLCFTLPRDDALRLMRSAKPSLTAARRTREGRPRAEVGR